MWDVTRKNHKNICISKFLLTHPVWDVTTRGTNLWLFVQFLLTHPVWDVTSSCWWSYRRLGISTHTSRVGCDTDSAIQRGFDNHFYSHIPCGMWRLQNTKKIKRFKISTHTSRVGCDDWNIVTRYGTYRFLLTHPVWDVTLSFDSTFFQLKISTHTSRVGCDYDLGDWVTVQDNFYSHIPCGMWHREWECW